jgi:hypothetical protein
MQRLKNHEPDTYRSLEDTLQSGTMPSLLFCRDLCRANPALLTLMHLSRHASVVSSTCVPSPPRVPTQQASMQQSNQLSLQPNCAAGAVGEVWWLFDSGAPYLAEVFTGGDVPTGRLPHVDRGGIHGKHVARVLGRRHSFVKLVARSARIILFTAWYATPHQAQGHLGIRCDMFSVS